MPQENDKLQTALLVLVGPDRVGIVHDVAAFVADHGGNIREDESRRFETAAFVVFGIEGRPDQLDKMEAELSRLKDSSQARHLFIDRVKPNGVLEGYERTTDRFRVTSRDCLGLMAALCGTLTELHVSIERHEGEQYKDDLPNAVTKYKQRFTVRRPSGCSWPDLSRAVSKVASQGDFQWSPE